MELDKIKQEIIFLEERIVDPWTPESGELLNQILSDDFLEFGSSGKIFTKEGVIKALSEQQEASIKLFDFEIELLAEGVVLAIYKAKKRAGNNSLVSLRSSIWIYRNSRWQIKFHQGTIANNEMIEIKNDQNLLRDIEQGREDVKNKRGRFVKL